MFFIRVWVSILIFLMCMQTHSGFMQIFQTHSQEYFSEKSSMDAAKVICVYMVAQTAPLFWGVSV